MLKYHYLVVTDTGVKFSETFAFSSVRRFPFSDIACVVLGPDHTLSFKVGEEIFSIPTKPNKPKHQAAISALLEGLQRSDPAASVQGAIEPVMV